MTGINILMIGLSFCGMLCTCTCSYVQTLYQNMSLFSEREIIRYARKSNDLKYCGTRVNEANFSTNALVAADWCETGIIEPGFKYFLKSDVQVTQVKSWGFSTKIPVCALNGSRIETLLTPHTGYTSIGIKIFNTAWDDILHLVLTSTELVDNVQSSVVIEINPDSFLTYINGIMYQRSPYPAGTPSYSQYFQIHPGPADIHMVRYLAAPDSL